ncbi:MAG: glycosyltransferase [Betaproteobacteria bacterium]|nr:glycosyltransferase [Betaproteobacteria bacterium]
MTDLRRDGLRILLTNNTLSSRAGSELYLRDLAISLLKRGHFPIAFSMALGEIAEELRRATIPVVDDLDELNVTPDLIHGQHHLETTIAALHFPSVPVVHVCHGWLPWEELPPILPNVKRYVAVDDLCRERLLTSRGIPAARIEVHLNFVDMDRFKLRPPLPRRPESALVFSNYVIESPLLAAIRGACHRFGIGRVDVVGACSGNPLTKPEDVLGNYDVVFAKARCALEAMASGCAVIVADYAGLGGLVTTESVLGMRRLNFGARAMQKACVEEEGVLRELSRFDSEDARRVSEWIRADADMAASVTRWIDLYREVLADQALSGIDERAAYYEAQLRAASEYLRRLAPVVKARADTEDRLKQAEVLETRLLQKETEWSEVQKTVRRQSAESDATQAALRQVQAELDSTRTALREGKTELETAQASLQGTNAELELSRSLLGQREAELREVHLSRTWRAINRCRTMLERLRSLGS